MHSPLHHLSLPSTAWLPQPMPNRPDRPLTPPASTGIATTPVDPHAAWRRPTRFRRSLLVGLALALPGGLFGALLGLATGAFTLGVVAGGLIAALAGATVEARSSAPSLPPRRSESNTDIR